VLDCGRVCKRRGGENYIFENTTSSGTIESSRCYTPKLNEANNVYFAVNRKSLNAFVCLRMRTKEATDIILGWIRSRKNILFDELKTGSVTVQTGYCVHYILLQYRMSYTVFVCYRQYFFSNQYF
jgi:hypothetical protein